MNNRHGRALIERLESRVQLSDGGGGSGLARGQWAYDDSTEARGSFHLSRIDGTTQRVNGQLTQVITETDPSNLVTLTFVTRDDDGNTVIHGLHEQTLAGWNRLTFVDPLVAPRVLGKGQKTSSSGRVTLSTPDVGNWTGTYGYSVTGGPVEHLLVPAGVFLAQRFESTLTYTMTSDNLRWESTQQTNVWGATVGGNIKQKTESSATTTMPDGSTRHITGSRQRQLLWLTDDPAAPLPAKASISGVVFSDDNGNFVQTPGERGLAGRAVYIDVNENGKQDSREPWAVSDVNGRYVIDSSGYPYNRRVRLASQPGTRRTLPARDFHVVHATEDRYYSGADFGVTRRSLVSGAIFDDSNGNGGA